MNILKVADFGYSKIVIANKLGIDVTDTQQLEGGSFLYLPPERLLGEEYSYPAGTELLHLSQSNVF
jgi:hypothetical protein